MQISWNRRNMRLAFTRSNPGRNANFAMRFQILSLSPLSFSLATFKADTLLRYFHPRRLSPRFALPGKHVFRKYNSQ